MKWTMWMLALAFGLCAMLAYAQDFPRQPLRIIVPFAQGTVADMIGRLVAEELKISLGQPVIVENRVGVSGLVGVGSLAHAPDDGHTIGIGNEATHVTVPLVRKKVAYDPVKDFTPLAVAVRTPMAIAVNPKLLPVRDVAGLLEAGRATAGGIAFGTMGEGSPQQLIGELLNQRAGTHFIHVPCASSPEAVQDAIAGKRPMVISTLATLLPHQDKLRIVAIADPARLPALPALPTIAETVPGVVLTGWSGFFAPAKVPPAVAGKLSKALAAALHKPAVA
ncbi:MAG TPA: tripartite tricarboxylate transporter substrate-binding protein, partial [Ramlibacter sp.]|uniref:Bug family tripartite tricarboxylate transporter substrate binding protein n=1 Tax=Ramlibacter sp. TaxID=1917967 RepID=UPI002D804F66